MAVEHGRDPVDGGSSCPSLETLAEFADGSLTGERRTLVEQHLAECADCRDVLADTMAFLAEEPQALPAAPPAVVVPIAARRPSRAIRLPQIAAAVLLAAAAIMLVVRVWRPGPPPGSRPELQELVAAMRTEARRPVEGRLTGGFTYAPPPSATRGTGDPAISPDVRIAVARIEKAEAERPSARALAALGIASLALGATERAVAALESAAAQEPDNAAWQSDLAAAYLASAKTAQRQEDLPKALNAANQAYRLNPASPEARFNRALALEQLGPKPAAIDAWREFIQVEKNEAWRQEAQRHLTALLGTSSSFSTPPVAPRVQDVTQPFTAQDAALAVHGSHKRAREAVLEEILPAWGAASASGREDAAARERLRRAALVAEALEADGGDTTARQVVDDIRRATPADRPRLEQMVVAYGEARRLENADRRQAAQSAFARAGGLARALNDPLWAWCAMASATAASDDHRLDGVEAALDPAFALASDRRLDALLAELHWVMGNVLGQRGQFVASLQAYERALEAYGRVGEIENIANIHSQAAYMYRLLGNPHREWEHRVQALALLPAIDRSARRFVILFGAGSSAFEHGDMLTALHFETAAAAEGAGANDPLSIAEALALRGRIHHAAGDTAAAQSDIAAARRQIAAVADPVFREGVEARVLASEAEIVADTDPARADRRFTEALEYFRSRQREDFLPLLYLARGRALARQGRTGPAGAAFEEGIAVFERRRRVLEADESGLSFFDRSWLLFAEQIQRVVAQDPGGESGLSYAERLHGAPGGLAIADVVAAVPPDAVLFYFVALPQRLMAWKFAQGRASLVWLPPIADVQVAADHLLRLTVAGYDRGAIDPAAARLFDMVMRPLLDGVPAETRLIIVPDGVLYRVPFALLRDDRTGRYLIEDHAVGVTPSIQMLLDSSRRLARARENRAPRLLLVAEPRVDRAVFGDLGDLPGSQEEAARIGARYADKVILSGSGATTSRFLAELPGSGIVHFSGHAVLNPATPNRSMLLFAPEAGRNGGELFVRDLRGLRLPNTELVVLAGCETAVGPISHSDGALALSRPFLIDGASAVVATLWKIDDRASAGVLDRFHAAYLQGRDAATALRRAQLEVLRQDPQMARFPSRWAGFQAVGAAAGVRAARSDSDE